MTNDTNGTTVMQGPQGGVVFLLGEDGAQYALPSDVLEAFRLDEAQQAAPRDDGDVEGYFEWPDKKNYAIYRMDGGGAASFYAGWAWNQFTFLVAGSNAKFEVQHERTGGGVRG